MSVVALIVAAGRGVRFKYETPKQYTVLNGKTVLRRSVEAFLNHNKVDNVIVVIHPLDLELYKESVKGLDLLDPILGGERRQDSVRHGLEALAYLNPKKVLIHDVARPFVEKQTISGVIEELDHSRAVIPAVLIEDTVKKCEDGKVLWTVDRSELWRSQTPQGFLYNEILNIHQLYKNTNFTDDCAIAEHANIPITIITGTQSNFKITTETDIERAEHFVISRERHLISDMRIGFGYDIHCFDLSQKPDKNNEIMLSFTKVPYDYKLIAHSDGDVVAHAVVDSILGAIGMDDIGTHFPPSDDKWKNASSEIFLRKTMEFLIEKNGKIKNIDITIVTEKPKISEYREQMRQNLANILQINVNQISIKGKTNEKMDAIGEGKAISAYATCLIDLNI